MYVRGICFFIGGVCEVIHNRCWATAPNTFAPCRVQSMIVYVYVLCEGLVDLNLQLHRWHRLLALRLPRDVGGLYHGDWHARPVAFVSKALQGTVLYLIGAVLGLCMWWGFTFSMFSLLRRTEQFGLSLISNLNSALDTLSSKRRCLRSS